MKLPRNVSGATLQASLRRLGYDTVRQRGSHVRITTQIHGEHHEVIPLAAPLSSPPATGGGVESDEVTLERGRLDARERGAPPHGRDAAGDPRPAPSSPSSAPASADECSRHAMARPLTNRTRARGGIRRLQVRFADGAQYVPEDQLEGIGSEGDDPLDLLKRGRLGDAADLRRAVTHARLTGRLADVITSRR